MVVSVEATDNQYYSHRGNNFLLVWKVGYPTELISSDNHYRSQTEHQICPTEFSTIRVGFGESTPLITPTEEFVTAFHSKYQFVLSVICTLYSKTANG